MHTSQKQVAPAPSVEGAQAEAGEDHGRAHEGRGEDAVKDKAVSRELCRESCALYLEGTSLH